jgi:hypothetical protein
MAEQKTPEKKISMSNTKQEMLKAYNALLQEVAARKEAELKPEKKREEKKAQEVVRVANSLSRNQQLEAGGRKNAHADLGWPGRGG